MKKRTHILFGLLIIFYPFLFSGDGYSQNTKAVYWFKKGVNEKDPDKKIQNYQKAIQENPAFVEAHYNLALLFITKKDYQKAEEALINALSASANTTRDSFKSNILNRLGTTYRKMGRYDDAEQAFKQALNISTDNKFKAMTLYELGKTKIFQQQYDEAVNYFRQGVRISPDDRASFETGIQLANNQQKIDTLFQQGMASIQNQKLPEAANIFNEIIELSPGHKEAIKQLERVTSLLEQRQEQRDQQIQPLYKQAMTNINEGNWTEAIKYLQRIKSIQPNYADINTLLSRAQEQQYQPLLDEQKIENFYVNGVENFQDKNFTVSLAHFEKVAELDPNYKDIQSRLQATKREMIQANELTDRTSQSEDATLSEFDDTVQMEYSSSEINSQQFIAEKSRQLDAAIDSQLVQNYYEGALDLMQKQEWQRAIILLEKVKLIKPNYKNTDFLMSQAKHSIEVANSASFNESQDQSGSGSSPIIIFALLASIVALPVAILSASPVYRAKYFILLKKYDRAREIYERMLTKKPNNVKLYITLANIYINENRVDEVAIRVFERAIQYNDNLKIQLEPIVTKYYLKKGKSSGTPKSLIQGDLKEELNRMGN